MTLFDDRTLETAFVPADAPRLSDVMERVRTDLALSPARRRDLSSGLRRVAAAIGWPLEEAPADVAWLQPRLADVAPAALGLSPKSWSNILSNARAALAVAGVVEGRRARPVAMTGEWPGLWRGLLASKDPSLPPALGSFVRFLSRMGVAPAEVGDAHAAAYREALARSEIRRDPDNAMRAAIFGWNLAVRRLPDWPRQTLTLASRSNRYALPLDRFPASFARDLDAFVAGMARPDPLDPDARLAPLRPASIRHRRAQVVRFASALVHAGVPVEEIADLAALVEPARAKLGLKWLLDRNGGASSPGVADLAVMLGIAARRHVRVPAAQEAELRDLATRLAMPVERGLTPKNRERLRPLEDPAALRRLARLPGTLEAKAAAAGPTHAAALDMEMAVAIAILLVCPIRRANLVSLHLDRNLRRMGDGRVFLIFDGSEVKNRRALEFELPPETAALIDRHVAGHRPRLCPRGSPWLFPRRDGGAAMGESQLSRRISKVVRRETGLEMHLHLFRHLAAMVMLAANPGAYEMTGRLLGHSRSLTALHAYAGFEAGPAVRAYAGLVDAARKGD